MQNTSNYNLLVYEGSDKFNPLTVENANIEAIDNAMADNRAGIVGMATELKSGVNHAITRENNDIPVFRFVATSDYNEGDTFTVDGVTVTGQYTNGKSLANRAYVANSNVLCVIVGSVLTIYAVATDAETLGGYAASAFAMADELKLADITNAKWKKSNVGAVVNEISTDVNSMLDGVEIPINQFFASTSGVSTASKIYRKGNKISGTIYFTGSYSVDVNGRAFGFATINTQYRPKYRHYNSGYFNIGARYVPCEFQVDENGGVILISPVVSTTAAGATLSINIDI